MFVKEFIKKHKKELEALVLVTGFGVSVVASYALGKNQGLGQAWIELAEIMRTPKD